MYLVSVILTIIAVLTTLYVSSFKKWMKNNIPRPYCPSYFVFEDPEDKGYKKKMLDDFMAPKEEQNGFMGCYCSKHTSWFLPWTIFMR